MWQRKVGGRRDLNKDYVMLLERGSNADAGRGKVKEQVAWWEYKLHDTVGILKSITAGEMS